MVQFASYVRRVLHKTRLIFSRINDPIVFQRDGNAEHVQKKLIESYPVLKECGG